MSTSQEKYAIDLSNEGVSLWHRDEKKQWILLGKVSLEAPNFSDDIEKLKNGLSPDGNGVLVARVRIPRSEVFVSRIDLAGSKGHAVDTRVHTFLSEQTPYASDDLIYDLDHKTDGSPCYIAAVTKQTISEAKEFVTGHGFQAAYYTTKFDAADFPRDARFYDGPHPAVEPEKTEAKKAAPVETEKAPETPPIPTPPTPKPTKVVKTDIKPAEVSAPEDEAPTQDENIPVIEKTDFSAFETVRSKELVAPKKGKKEPTLPKASFQSPTPRLSIGMTDADAKRAPEKTIGLTAGTLKTPQGKTAKNEIKGKLKARHFIILIALILITLAYWFFTTLFDGKEEIARLNEQPAPEVVIESPEIVDVAPVEQESQTEIAPTSGTETASVPTEVPIVEEEPVEVTEEALTEEQQTEVEVAQTNIDAAKKEAEAIIEPVTNDLAEAQTNIEYNAPVDLDADVIAETAPETVVEQENTEDAIERDTALSETTDQTEIVTLAPQETSIVETTPVEVETEQPLVDLVPTKDGTLGAEGITLFAGVPDIIPPVREQLNISPDPLKDILPKMRSDDFAEIHKAEIEAAAQLLAQAPEADVTTDENVTVSETIEQTVEETLQEPDLLALADPALKALQPRARPAVIADRVKEIAAAALAPPADPELAALKPRQRPRSLKILKEEIKPQPVDPSEIQVAIQEAVRDIARPRARPSNLSRKVARLKADEAKSVKKESIQTAALTPRTARGTSKPSSATVASVQRQATEKASVNKRRISLIGVYGKASSRRALVRMPSGRYVKVKSGQSFSGWNVAAIGESSVRITKGSRNQVLRMPKR
ncbi:type IV pilus biogenesis protein PilP [Amylibacter sp. SFDW26]|uniref:type IV pilus biogenesis protein PilP n=1 Tax=Amylibacter sp. SFDW26 TaxID=2652722 RepID=UPI001262103A|nr:type IV pilus biogenesis protein PilP [Amylibacter sp. SFDW26]KAB7615428.1 type IV pilus biogenesis protein PilP [Amylibacter sp. SFDW26]